MAQPLAPTAYFLGGSGFSGRNRDVERSGLVLSYGHIVCVIVQWAWRWYTRRSFDTKADPRFLEAVLLS